MSTRSGKRIHKSLHENITGDSEVEATGDRKTRSRRLKANCDALNVSLPKTKKRVNYVSYPSTDEDHTSGDSTKEVSEQPVRPLRKHTLKEITLETKPQINGIEEGSDSESKRKPTRVTRKTKKFTEQNDELPNSQGEPEEVPKKANKKKKANSKAQADVDCNEKENDVAVSQKKGKRKKNKKKSLEEKKVTVENKVSLNNSATSVDSFHSADGSPIKPMQPEKLNGTSDKLKHPINATATIEKADDLLTLPSKSPRMSSRRKSSIVLADVTLANESPDKTITRMSPKDSNITDDEDAEKLILSSSRRSSKRNSLAAVKDSTFDKTAEETSIKVNTTFDKADSDKKINSTFEKSKESTSDMKNSDSTDQKMSNGKLDTTFDKDSTKLDSTFDKNEIKNPASNDTVNLTFDKSDDNISRISITSDESKMSTENILNATPVLIESSIDSSQTPETVERATRSSLVPPSTPLKREGTFTKDSPEVSSPKPKSGTPMKRQMSMPSPGRTPYLSNSKSGDRKQKILNRTHSLDKSDRKFSFTEPQRMTKVMFCSPVNTPVLDTQRKSKVIKSSMKGSNKSFVFQDNGGSTTNSGRKRPLAQRGADDCASVAVGEAAEAAPGAKRKKLADDIRLSVDRLSRPRTPAVVVKPSSTSATKSDLKRAKLPNFAALHQRQFAKMESLGECQQRRAQRARRLLAPAGALDVLARGSPRVPAATEPPKSSTKDISTVEKKKETPTKTKPDNSKLGYTRFGFKLNLDVNPFSIPSKNIPTTEVKDAKPMEKRPNGLKRQPTFPSLVGATSVRKEVAKQVLLREKSSTALKERRDMTRNENRTIIKGVRTNRRFELQMRSRNI